MRILWLLLALAVLTASPSVAQQIRVRSGEHEDFSRLVFMLPPGTNWSATEVPGGVRLETQSRGVRFDTSTVFDLIPKTRIKAIRPEMDSGALFIETASAVRLESFQLPIGAVVLDIIDGPPAAHELSLTPPHISHRPEPNGEYLGLYWAGRTNGPTARATTTDAKPEKPISPDFVPGLSIPDPRISAVETALVDQMGRAASQGLITMELPRKKEPARQDQTAGKSAEPDPLTASDPRSAPKGQDAGLAVQAETVIDRDTLSGSQSAHLTETGHTCPADKEYDLLSWRGEDDPAAQIAAARRDLVGEFDRPRREAIDRLVQVYLALGFGTEAKAVMRAFKVAPEESQNYRLLADVIEGDTPQTDLNLEALSACDSKAALWATLAAAQTPKREAVNFGAVLRAYSALPPNLRAQVGPALSARLIDMGAPDLAATVRSMLARAPVEHEKALNLMDAQLALKKGKTDAAVKRLDLVAQGQSPDAAESLALSLETKLAAHQALPNTEVENAAALALQLKGTDLGSRLARIHVLGLGSTGAFDDAFAALHRWRKIEESPRSHATVSEVSEYLAKVPDERFFTETCFKHFETLASGDLSSEIQVQLSERLSRNGFSKSARDVLDSETRKTERGRLALARAALAGRDAAAAYSHLAGLSGSDASALRGEALSALGQHDTAQIEFAVAGNQEAQVREAWRSGDWSLVSERGTETEKRFLKLFAAPPASPAGGSDTPAAAQGPLAQAQELLGQSQSERDALAKIMQDLKLP